MTATKLAVALAAAGMLAALPAKAAIFTDQTLFNNAATADGITTSADNFSSYAQQNITFGQTLGSFNYTFPSQTQPAIVPNGTFVGNALGGAPFDVFVGGDSVTLTFAGSGKIRAFGMDISAAPSGTDPLPDNIYQLTLLDGNQETVGNVNLSVAASNEFFLGFVEDAANPFTQIDLSLAPNPNGFLVPAIQVNQLDFGSAPAAAAVPEPASIVLLGGALLMAGALTRRRAKR